MSEIGSHWLDLASYLTGLRAEAVSATFGCFHPQRVLKDGMMYPVHQGVEGTPVAVHTEDAAAVTIRYENGVLGNVLLSEVSPGRGNRLTIERQQSFAHRPQRSGCSHRGVCARKRLFRHVPSACARDVRGDSGKSVCKEYIPHLCTGRADRCGMPRCLRQREE